MLKLTGMKKVLFSIVALLGIFLFLELGIRVFFAFKVGPSVLLYGTRFNHKQINPSTSPAVQSPDARPEAKTFKAKMSRREWNKKRTAIAHTNVLSGYSKYYPNQKRVDFDIETGESFNVTINSRGFRGKDFDDQKKPGVIRILALGASSTFGYFDRDDETYPVYLEQVLSDRFAGEMKFEVINLAVPHLTSEEIYALFMAEGVQLNPDVVTFYEGNNDAARIASNMRWDAGIFSYYDIKAGKRLMLIAFLNSILETYSTARISPDKFRAEAPAVSSRFLDGIARIHHECKERGILFVVANQQKNSQTIDRGKLKGMTYEEEVEKCRVKLLQSDQMESGELELLMHDFMMKDLRTWAVDNQVPFVDIIDRLDQDRDVLVSWVHLSPRGNRMVAEAFADEISNHKWNPRASTLQ